MFRVELRKTIDAPWTAMEPVRVGDVPAGLGVPAVFVTVEKDASATLRVDLYEGEPAPHPFQDAVVWGDVVVIGFGAHVYLVSLASHDVVIHALNGFFGHLYPLPDKLLVADMDRLHCLDKMGSVLWQSRPLAVDGVYVHRVEDGVIEGEGQAELPDFSDPTDMGDWRPFRLSLAAGLDVPSPDGDPPLVR